MLGESQFHLQEYLFMWKHTLFCLWEGSDFRFSLCGSILCFVFEKVQSLAEQPLCAIQFLNRLINGVVQSTFGPCCGDMPRPSKCGRLSERLYKRPKMRCHGCMFWDPSTGTALSVPFCAMKLWSAVKGKQGWLWRFSDWGGQRSSSDWDGQRSSWV